MASKRHLRHRACTRKVRYASHAEAMQALAWLLAREGPGTLQLYTCVHCRGVHAGHPPRPQNLRRADLHHRCTAS